MVCRASIHLIATSRIVIGQEERVIPFVRGLANNADVDLAISTHAGVDMRVCLVPPPARLGLAARDRNSLHDEGENDCQQGEYMEVAPGYSAWFHRRSQPEREP